MVLRYTGSMKLEDSFRVVSRLEAPSHDSFLMGRMKSIS